MILPSGLALGLANPTSCIRSKARLTLCTYLIKHIKLALKVSLTQSKFHLLVKIMRGVVKGVQRHEESLKETHQQRQVDAIVELSVQVGHFKAQLVQVFVHECHKRLKKVENYVKNHKFHL
jgi:hypothetical protein